MSQAGIIAESGGNGGVSAGAYPGFMTGDAYYTSAHGTRSLAITDTITITTLVGDILFTPFFCGIDFTWDRISAYCQTAGSSGDEIELLIYDNGSDGQPDNLLVSSGSLDISSTGLKEATINYAMSAGWYWLGCLIDNGNSGSPKLYAFETNSTLATPYICPFPRLAASINTDQSSLRSTGTFTVGNATNDPSVSLGTGDTPMIFLRKT